MTWSGSASARDIGVDVKRWFLRVYPELFRRRYEDELLEMLDESPQPVRDVLDVAVHAGRLRGEQLMTNAARAHLANLALAASIFVLGYAINDLQNGFIEIPDHWWSASAVLFVATAAAVRLTIDSRAKHGRTTSPSDPG